MIQILYFISCCFNQCGVFELSCFLLLFFTVWINLSFIYYYYQILHKSVYSRGFWLDVNEHIAIALFVLDFAVPILKFRYHLQVGTIYRLFSLEGVYDLFEGCSFGFSLTFFYFCLISLIRFFSIGLFSPVSSSAVTVLPLQNVEYLPIPGHEKGYIVSFSLLISPPVVSGKRFPISWQDSTGTAWIVLSTQKTPRDIVFWELYVLTASGLHRCHSVLPNKNGVPEYFGISYVFFRKQGICLTFYESLGTVSSFY